MTGGRTLRLKVRSLFLCLFFLPPFLSVSAPSMAEPGLDFIRKARELDLAAEPFWRKLLHFQGRRSQIRDDDFFLSENGQTDPRAELEATINAYFTGDHSVKREGGDTHIVCVFPARYMWLNSRLGLPDFRIDEKVCPALTRWARLNQIEAVSVVYVSGYLGNPASSFGHALLNLKLKGSDELFGLFDTSSHLCPARAVSPSAENRHAQTGRR